MNQQSLGQSSCNQPSSAEKKKDKIQLKSKNKIIDATCGGQKFVILGQKQYDQVIKQMFQRSFPIGQSNNQEVLEKQAQKQVDQLEQNSSQQLISSDSSLICYESCEKKKIPFFTQLTDQKYSVPYYYYNQWNNLLIDEQQLKLYISIHDNDVWVRLLCHDQNQVIGLQNMETCLDDLINLLFISSHIGICSRSNKFEERINIIKMEVGTLKSDWKHRYQQLLNIVNGMTPEGKEWRDKGSSKLQLKMVGEDKNKELVEFIIGGQDKEKKNVFLSIVKDKMTTTTILFGENKIRSVWLKLK